MIGDGHGEWIASSETYNNIFDCDGGDSVCLHKGKEKRWRKKVKYQLIGYHSLPGFLRDNEFILGYYRSEWPLKQVFLSIFSVHNETLNIWT
jgi:adiponectin receptor